MQANQLIDSATYLQEATQLRPQEALFHDELSVAYAQLALAFQQAEDSTQAAKLTQAALNESASVSICCCPNLI